MKDILKKEHIITLIAGIVIGAILGATLHKNTVIVREGVADNPAALTSVNLMIDNGHGSVRTWNTVTWHEAMSVMDLLDLVSGTGNITYTGNKERTKVVSIDGVLASATSSERWQYWVNNNYEPRVPDKYYLKPGDIIVWKFTADQSK